MSVENTDYPNQKVAGLRKSVAGISRLIFLITLLIPFSIYSIIHTPAAQSYLRNLATKILEEKTGASVEVGKIGFDVFRGLNAQKILIRDEQKDTLIFVGKLSTSLNKNLIYLIFNKADLSDIYIADVKINMIRREGDRYSGLQLFFKKLLQKQQSEKKNNFSLELHHIYGKNLGLFIDDMHRGVNVNIKIPSIKLGVDKLDLECGQADIDNIYLREPSVIYSVYDYACYSEDELAVLPKNAPFRWFLDFDFGITCSKLSIENGKFKLDNFLLPINKSTYPIFDPQHFQISDIKLIFQKLRLDQEGRIKLQVPAVAMILDNQIELQKFSVDSISLSESTGSIGGIQFKTNNSQLRTSFSLGYEDFESWKNFQDEVILKGTIEKGEIDFGELSYFIKGLNESPSLVNLRNEKLFIEGKLNGRIAHFSMKNMKAGIGKKLLVLGDFHVKNIADLDNLLLNVKIEQLSTHMRHIKNLFPSVKLPANYYKLGDIRFKGRFDGYLEDFVAFGTMRSDIGVADVDMRLDLTGGLEYASYSGKLDLKKFNLGVWSGNKDFGLLDFSSKVEKGQGLIVDALQAELNANVNSLVYKNYEYRDLSIRGEINKSTFDGSFEIRDENIDLNFEGVAEYLQQKTFLNFSSDIRNLNLYALNLVNKPLKVSGKIDINTSGNSINDLLGNIDIRGIEVAKNDSIYTINEIKLQSKILLNGGKELSLFSDLGTVLIRGDYDIPNLIPTVKQIIRTNYPAITKNWSSQPRTKSNIRQYIDFDIRLGSSKNLFDLIGLPALRFSKLDLKGRVDSYKNEISIACKVPELFYNSDKLKNLQLLVSTDNKRGDVLLHIDTTFALGKKFNPLDFQTKAVGDSISFNIAGTGIVEKTDILDISGLLVPHPNGFSVKLKKNTFNILGKYWDINEGNQIVFGENYVDINDFQITDGFRSLELLDLQNKGLNLVLKNFDIKLLNPIIKEKRFLISGLSDISLEADNLYKDDMYVAAAISVPAFYVNGDPYGSIHVYGEKTETSRFDIDVNVGDFFKSSGYVNLADNSLKFKLKFRQAKLKLLEYLLKDGISETEGYINADASLWGKMKDWKLAGNGMVFKGKTKVLYTGVTYLFDQQKFSLTEKSINLDGAEITDNLKNKAIIKGELVHQRFKNFGAQIRISSNNIIALNTTIKDNIDYYGYAIGNATVTFSGSFDKLDMDISARTGLGSKLYIPVGTGQASAQVGVVRFEKRNGYENGRIKKVVKASKGINLEMDLVLTPDAEVNIIFDEAKGDIIRGTGRGNLKVLADRNDNFEIFGDYEIEQGNYLFTVATLPVAKPFQVVRGGTIRWTGDPVNAALDIDAVYRSRTLIRPFIEEYLTFASDQTISQASQRQEVDLILHLGGLLFKPEVKFNLAFPNIVGELASLTDSKLRIVQNNENELNSQAFGLIMFNAFLPSNRVSDVIGAGGIQSLGINTVSEFLSNQLSLYITNLINQALEENNVWAGIDFEIGMRNNTATITGVNDANIFPDEIEFRLKNRFKFLEERMSLNVGGNYVFQNQGQVINQILPDFSLELILTDDRKLKARLYGRTDLNLVGFNTLAPKLGLGLTFRTEFGEMNDFERRLKNNVKSALLQ